MFVSTTSPKFGEITACTEPDFSLSISPSASAGTLNNPEPSPLINPPDISPVTNIPPLIDADVLTKNPYSSDIDALTDPSNILLCASGVSASGGMFINSEPSPTKEPLYEDAVIPPSTFKDVLISTDEVDIFICSTP